MKLEIIIIRKLNNLSKKIIGDCPKFIHYTDIKEFNLSEKRFNDDNNIVGKYWETDIKEFIRLLDWDKDDYDKLKCEIEKRFRDCDRSLWEYAFDMACRMFMEKKINLAGKDLI